MTFVPSIAMSTSKYKTQERSSGTVMQTKEKRKKKQERDRDGRNMHTQVKR